MVDRDTLMAYLVLVGFEKVPSPFPLTIQGDEFVLRSDYRAFRPIAVSITVFQNKTHIEDRTEHALLSIAHIATRGQGLKRRGHHGWALRWVKDNLHKAKERAIGQRNI